MTQQTCPFCHKPVTPFERYPRYACMNCVARAKSKDGRLLQFSNIDTSGGFAAEYAATGETYEGHECYIDGVLCHADEGHFGGIVVQPFNAGS